MKLSEYYNNQRIINEKLNNNITIINGEKLLLEHAKDIDSLLYKFNVYTSNIFNQNVNEGVYDEQLTLNESVAARDLLIFACESYRDELVKEMQIYESVINNNFDVSIITEDKFMDKLKNTLQKGKDKLVDAYKAIKTKIQEINELIKDLINKAINTVKGMAERLVNILSKLACSVKDLFEKIVGKDHIQDVEDSWVKDSDEMAKKIASDPKLISKENVYESAAEYYRTGIINESNEQIINELFGFGKKKDKEVADDGKGKVVNQGKKINWREILIKALKQLGWWAVVCVGIPGIFVAFFPGTFLALLVPIICKLLWSARKIPQMWKQYKKIKSEWPTYSKKQKWIAVCCYVVSVGFLVWNIHGIVSNAMPLMQEFAKSGFKLMGEAKVGIQPDIMVRAFGALVKMAKEGKFSLEDYGKAFGEISDSFQKEVPEMAEKLVKTTTKTTAKVGQSGKDFLNKFKEGDWKNSMKPWKVLHSNEISPEPSNLADNGMYDLVFDGSPGSACGKKILKWCQDQGLNPKPDKALNKALNTLNNNAGSMYGMKLPGWAVKKMIQDGVDFGHNSAEVVNGAMKGISIIGGEVAKEVDTISIVKDTITHIIPAISQSITLPVIAVAPENAGGFRVRLGEPGSKNYVYEIGETGVRENDINKHAEYYKPIREQIIKNNEEMLKSLMEQVKNEKDEDAQKKLKDAIDELQKRIKDNIDEGDCIIFYGKRVKEKANESYIGLSDYLIVEGITNANILDSLDKMRRWLSDRLSTSEVWKDKDKQNKEDKQKEQDKVNKQRAEYHKFLRKIFSKEKFKDDNLEKDEKHLMAMFISKEFKDIQYDTAAELVTLIHKLYTKCTLNNKESESKEKNNDIGIEEKLLYNKIYDLLSKIKQFKKEVADNRSSDILKKFKIKAKDPEDVQKKVKQLKDEIEKETPEKESSKKITDIIDDDDSLSDDEKKAIKKNLSPVKNEPEENEDTGEEIKPKENTEEEKKDEETKPEENKTDEVPKGEPKDASDKPEEDSDDYDKLVPVLIFAKCYGADIAKATSSGPRKEIYTLKNCHSSLEYILIEKGTSQDKINKMLGDILYKQSADLYNVIAVQPCDDKNKPAKGMNNEVERKDMADLSNDEFIKLQKDKDGKKLIESGGGKMKIASSKKDKERKAEYQKENDDTLKGNNDALKELNEVCPGVVDDDGNIDNDKYNDVLDKLSDYQLSRYKQKNEKGFWAKVKRFFKNLFGDYSEDDMEKANAIVKKYRKTNESLDASVLRNTKLSLSKYIKMNR